MGVQKWAEWEMWVIWNKERLVCKGCAQEEGVDYGETFSQVSKFEGVRNFLAYVPYKEIKVCQMDVKCAFLIKFLRKKSTLNNQKDLSIQTKGIWYISYKNNYIIWSKPLEHGMKGYTITWWKLVLQEWMTITICI